MTTNDRVDVSVIMPAFNAEKYVAEAAKSIFDQTFTNFELIVVNDGSTDRTLEILNAIADDRLRILSNDNNMGVVKSTNKGIAEARGRYIARQDADDISLPERLQKQFEYLEQHPEIALLGTGRKTMSGTGTFKKQKTILERPTFKDLLKGNCFTQGSVMIRKKALEVVGNYNELFHLSEDYELWLRIAKQFSVANLPEALYILRRHSESVSWKYIHILVLYRLLAKELAQGKVRDEMLSQIRKEGIESCYQHLSRENKIFYHQKLATSYKHLHRHSESLQQYLRLQELQGLKWNYIRNILRLKLRSLFAKNDASPSKRQVAV